MIVLAAVIAFISALFVMSYRSQAPTLLLGARVLRQLAVLAATEGLFAAALYAPASVVLTGTRLGSLLVAISIGAGVPVLFGSRLFLVEQGDIQLGPGRFYHLVAPRLQAWVLGTIAQELAARIETDAEELRRLGISPTRVHDALVRVVQASWWLGPERQTQRIVRLHAVLDSSTHRASKMESLILLSYQWNMQRSVDRLRARARPGGSV